MTLWVPRPSEIVAQRATGTGNMGDVTDRMSTARFSLDAERYALCWIRQLYAGGTGSAKVSLKVDHREDVALYDFTLLDWPEMGTDGTVWDYTRMTADEMFHWTFLRGDILVFTWTNPDPVDTRWSIEVGLADATLQ